MEVRYLCIGPMAQQQVDQFGEFIPFAYVMFTTGGPVRPGPPNESYRPIACESYRKITIALSPEELRISVRMSGANNKVVERVGLLTGESPPITQITFLACRAHYPGGPNRCLSVSSLSARPSPVNRRVGIHDFTFEACSSFTRVTACKIACPPKGGLLSRGFDPASYPTDPLGSYHVYRQLHGWILPPLVICAVGAHC